MPFELGLFMGAKQYGGKRHKAKRNLILIEKKYEMPKFLSDLGGNDAVPHENQLINVIDAVRCYLGRTPNRERLPGAKSILDAFTRFNADLPRPCSRSRPVLRMRFDRSGTTLSISIW